MLHIEKDLRCRRGELMPEFEAVADAAVGRAIQAGLQWIGVVLKVFDKNPCRQEAAVLEKLASRAIPPPRGR